MRFSPTKIAGVVVIEPELHEDDRGFFTRVFCREEFRAHGLVDHIEQSSLSFNRKRGTLRGLHYQAAPHEETKVVACTEGRIFDVAVDLRPGSPTLGQWFGTELAARSRRMLYIGAGIAHGLLTLEDDSTVLYQISSGFKPEASRGLRWNDPRLGIAWPLHDHLTTHDLVICERDRTWPDWEPPASEDPP